MRHSREEVIERAIKEFSALDRLVGQLTDEEWRRRLARPESKDPWTVKDVLAHITYWKAGVARTARREPRPVEERGLKYDEQNHMVYLRWRERPPQEVLAWHRQVQEDLLKVLREAPEAWFSGRERGPDWPSDLDGHARTHRIKDIEKALKRDGE